MRVIWDIFSGDVRNLFRNVIAAIVVMGLALVPPMYAWFTTLGFWDPYDNTGNIKVAVASEDAGYTSDLIPTPVNAGEQIIGKLRANDQFAWQFVGAEAAVEGVRSGEYYAALVIPKEFSRDLMTVFSDDITEPKIIYYDNEKENAIAQRVTATGASTLQETIDETFTETVASVALGTTSSLTSFMSGDGILTYAQTLGSRLGEAVGEVGAAADQAQAYADLMGSTTSLVNATANILKEAGKAPDATAPLVSEAQEGLTSGRDGLSAASTAAEKALTAADASYDAVARAADEAFATMKDNPAAAQGVLAACRSDVQGLAQARDDLQHALDTGDIDEVRRIIGDNPAAIAQFLAAPTHLERHAVYPMADNGSAMSPFYTSLALWIGAIFMVALMSVPVSPARQAALTKKFGRAPRPGELYLGRYGVFCLLGLAQALIVGLGNVFFLGVECEHFWLYLAACCLASVVFTNLVYTLTVSFGNIGKALAIIGLVLQLAGAGGLMPVQMLSAPLFQEIYPWLPFAHSMPALEGAMAGIYGDQYLVQMGLLAAILAPSLVLGLVLRRPVIRLNDWVLAKLDETKFL